MMINEDLLSRRYKVMYDLTFKKSKKGKKSARKNLTETEKLA